MLLVNQAAQPEQLARSDREGTKSNRDAIGAKVTVAAGGHRFVQEVRSGSSYISNNDMSLHFGLGNASAVDHIEIRWPNGNTEVFPGSGQWFGL